MALGRRGIPSLPWQERQIRPGALFLVGDPKQAIYRFRGADVATYLAAKNALAARDPASILEISANFRSQAPILEFVNQNFAGMLDAAQGQPGFVALAPVRQSGDRPAVATFEITVEDRHKGDRGLIVDELRREEAGIVADIVQNASQCQLAPRFKQTLFKCTRQALPEAPGSGPVAGG